MKERSLVQFDIIGFLYGIDFSKVIRWYDLTDEEGWSLVWSYTEVLDGYDFLDMGNNALKGLKVMYRI